MAVYTIVRNSSVEIDLTTDYGDNGWSISSGKAYHNDCNSGFLVNSVFLPTPTKVYSITVNIEIASGRLDVYLGGALVSSFTQTGVYTVTTTAIRPEGLTFWADGVCIVNSFSMLEGEVSGTTILFNQDSNQFVGTRSYTVDRMAKFIDDFISFKNGRLWLHDKSDTINTFHGIKYPSQVSFWVNIDPDADKDFYTVRQLSSNPWSVEVEIPGREGDKLGKRSRLKKGNFKLEKGVYSADIMKDMNDPRFSNELEALFKGGDIQGKLMRVTMTNDSEVAFELGSVEVEVSLK